MNYEIKIYRTKKTNYVLPARKAQFATHIAYCVLKSGEVEQVEIKSLINGKSILFNREDIPFGSFGMLQRMGREVGR